MPTNTIELTEEILASISGMSRMFLRGGTTLKLNPSQAYVYKGRTTIDGGIGMTRGEPQETTAPSDRKGGDTTSIQTIAGTLENRTANITQKADANLAEVYWGLIGKNRPSDIALPGGNSRAPQDIDDWDHLLLLEDVVFTELTIGEALNPQEEANALLDISGTFSYNSSKFSRVLKVSFAETAAATIARELVGAGYREVDNGVEFYALQVFATGATEPIIIGRNYQGTWSSVTMASAFANTEDATDMAVVGSYAVIVSNDAGGHAVISLSDVLAGTDSSSLVTSGYTGTKEPNAIFARSAGELYFVGDGGYIYKATSPTGGVTAKDAGSATTQNLNDIHGYKRQMVAVGASNACVVSSDNGENWTSKTGPSVGNALTACWMLDEDIIFVGTNNSELFYSIDFGDSWTEIAHGTGMTTIHDIQFVPGSKTVGYMVGDTGSAGKIARTVDGGATWHITTPYIASQPTSVDLNALAVVDTNTVLAVGEGAASDGIAIVIEDD